MAPEMTTSPAISAHGPPVFSLSRANRQPSMETSAKVRRPAAESGRRSRSMPTSRPMPSAVAKASTGAASSGATKLMDFLSTLLYSVKLSHATPLRNRSRCRQRIALRFRNPETVSRPARTAADSSYAEGAGGLSGGRSRLGRAGAGGQRMESSRLVARLAPSWKRCVAAARRGPTACATDCRPPPWWRPTMTGFWCTMPRGPASAAKCWPRCSPNWPMTRSAASSPCRSPIP